MIRRSLYIKNSKPTLMGGRKTTIKNLNADKALDRLEADMDALEALVFGQKSAYQRLYV